MSTFGDEGTSAIARSCVEMHKDLWDGVNALTDVAEVARSRKDESAAVSLMVALVEYMVEGIGSVVIA